MSHSVASLHETGLLHLSAGRWQAARTAFESALRTTQAPQSLEGLSWAVWWLDDATALFATRERACRL